MIELYNWVTEHWKNPLSASSIALLILILIDKFGRKLITSQVKRLFHVQDKSEFKQYVENQRRIEKKINAIMDKEGIIWSGEGETDTSGVTSSSTLSPSYSEKKLGAQIVKKYMRWRKMNLERISKANLLGLFSAIALFVKQVTGYVVPVEQIDLAVNGTLIILAIVGVFVNRKKPKKDAFLQEGGE